MFKIGKFIIMSQREQLENEQRMIALGLQAGRALALYQSRLRYCKLNASDTVTHDVNPMTISKN